LRFQVGTHVVDFVSPRQAHSPLINWLREFGPSPYAAVLKSSRDGAESLDSGLTHGAQLLVARELATMIGKMHR
ncbi:MAG: hypothetical protein M3N35_00185, partial [Candidatus Binatota bacterium]|nr:hypothetical protein [Candidatus Binatota bacterium]